MNQSSQISIWQMELESLPSVKQDDKDRSIDEEYIHRKERIGAWNLCIQCCIIGTLIMSIVLGIVIALWLTTKPKTGTNLVPGETTSTISTTSATTKTLSTTTSSTSSSSSSTTTTSATTSSTSTSTTTSTSTSTSTTSTTTTTTTSSTTSTSTSTSTTSTTTTTTTSATTTTTAYVPCDHLFWNPSGSVVAGTGVPGAGLSQLDGPWCLYIDQNDNIYVCDHGNNRAQKWAQNATSGVTVAGAIAPIDATAITVDKNGNMYVVDHVDNYIAKFPPGYLNGTVVAGTKGVSSTSLSLLNNPHGVAVDDDLNVYIADTGNKRVMKWAQNATIGTAVITSSGLMSFYRILLSPHFSNYVYLSSNDKDTVYLWQLNGLTPSIEFNRVNASATTLNAPKGIRLDHYGNLYVADSGNRRIVRYCNGSTVGSVVIAGGTSTPGLDGPEDIAFDKDLNMYVVDRTKDRVIKFKKI